MGGRRHGWLFLLLLLALSGCGGDDGGSRPASAPASQAPAAAKGGGAPVAGEKARSLLLITANDMGPQLRVYGDATAKTPRIDRLAREGAWFTRAYTTQSSDSPARSSMLTSLYPHQNGQIGLVGDYAMHAGIATLPGLLRDAGYRTALIGALGVAPPSAFPFDEVMLAGSEVRGVFEVERLADAFLRRSAGAPFFLMVSLSDPHRPFEERIDGIPGDPLPAQDALPFPWLGIDTATVRQQVAGYYNGVARVDAGVGLLLDALDRNGRSDDSVVIFIADNGPPFVRAKTTLYEPGIRIPFVVRWPGLAPLGESDALVSTLDVLPTSLEAALRPTPRTAEGRSLLPLLRGEAPPWRDAVFAEYTAHRKDHYYPRRAVRGERYKLIVNLESPRANPIRGVDGDPTPREAEQPRFQRTAARRAIERAQRPPREELFDLQADPNEWRNLADDPSHRETLEKLRERLRAWQVRTFDPLQGEQP